MKQKRFSEIQIMQILKQAEGGGLAAALIAERRASKPHSPLLDYFEKQAV